jgi:hypothetical protein
LVSPSAFLGHRHRTCNQLAGSHSSPTSTNEKPSVDDVSSVAEDDDAERAPAEHNVRNLLAAMLLDAESQLRAG